MSTARNYATDYVVHAFGSGCAPGHPGTACGKLARARDRVTAEPEWRSLVTCKRCLASLARADRAFQRKARRWFGSRAQAQSLTNTLRFRADEILNPWAHASRKLCVERAIAREEGRAL